MKTRSSKDPSSKDPSITQADIDEVCLSYEGTKVGDWFMHLITSYKDTGAEAGKDLKDAILNDLMAWSVLGSFLSAIAFELLFERIKKEITTGNNWWESLTNFLRAFEPHSEDKFFHLPSSGEMWGSFHEFLLQPLFNWDMVFTCMFMYAATCSLKGVICGTFKYLMFVPCPPSHISKAMCAYINLGFTTPPASRTTWLEYFIYSINEPFYGDWNHQDPIIMSTKVLLFAAFLVVFIQFGFFPGVFVGYLGYRFHGLISEIRGRTYASSWHYLTNIQDPLYRFHKIQDFTMEKIKGHFKNCQDIEERISKGIDKTPKIKKYQSEIQENMNKRKHLKPDGLDRKDVLTLQEIEEIHDSSKN